MAVGRGSRNKLQKKKKNSHANNNNSINITSNHTANRSQLENTKLRTSLNGKSYNRTNEEISSNLTTS